MEEPAMKSLSHWRAGQSLALLVGQALMLAVTVALVLGIFAVIQIAQG
jgi:hypothetical protein